MLRTFFASLGVLFAAILVFCASYFGNVAADIRHHGTDYEKLAVAITRELSRTWSLTDIEAHYAEDARSELAPVLDASLDGLKPLGVLLYADNVEVETLWSRGLGQARSPAAVAERVAELISRSVKVKFVGKFAGGLADVTAELRREQGKMKLWRLKIDSREPLRPDSYPGRRVISHA
jgi:hypothetical protein